MERRVLPSSPCIVFCYHLSEFCFPEPVYMDISYTKDPAMEFVLSCALRRIISIIMILYNPEVLRSYSWHCTWESLPESIPGTIYSAGD